MVEKSLFDKEPLRWGDAARIEGIGIYAIFLLDVSVAPDDWQADLQRDWPARLQKDWPADLQNEHNLLYIGEAKKDVLKRRLSKHFTGNKSGLNNISRKYGTSGDSSNSTFRRSVGAMLLHTGLDLELIYRTAGYKRNGKYSFRREEPLSKWIQENCAFTFCPMEAEDIEEKEAELIEKCAPPLNDTDNPCKRQLLEDARSECRKLAKIIQV